MNEIVRERLAEFRQQDLKLMNTRRCIEMLRDARKKDFPPEFTNELYLLVVAMAKQEWGQETTVDDFTLEGKFIIAGKGRRVEV